MAMDPDSSIVRRGRASDEEESSGAHLSLQVSTTGDAQGSSNKAKPVATPAQAQAAAARGKGPTKILFLDGVRGLAAILVVTQHTGYMGDVNLGLCAVDIFFVLSSFLLTWLFYKKSAQLLAQQVTLRKWGFALADYFSKRFFRVYPLFAAVAIFVWLLPYEKQMQYFLNKNSKPGDYALLQVLTFDFPHRFHVFWTLPLEIAYYFLIPLIVLVAIALGRAWWVPCLPLYYWIWSAGWTEFRGDHQPLMPHLPTFVCGSLTAILFVKLDGFIKERDFEFKRWQVLAIRGVEFITFWLLLSVCYRGLFFHWFFDNPAPVGGGARFISLHVGILIVIEMILPSPLSTVFEWSVLRYWGKISFSVYLLHSFVIYTQAINSQPNYYDKLFSQFFLIFLLSTASYQLIEYPSQVLSTRISKALAQMESGGSALATTAAYKPVATSDRHEKASAA